MSIIKKFIDIGANLTDPMFNGRYHGSQKHESDFIAVLDRAWINGLQKIIITGGSLEDSSKALQLARTNENLYSTVGCHPTRCSEFEKSGNSDAYLQSLIDLGQENKDKVIAIGECGLDYDRIEFCPKETQKRFFQQQLIMCETLGLPLFLHCRNATADVVEILSHNRDRLHGGVVHSFDGSEKDAAAILELGFYIGLNGCSLKTEENLQVVAGIPSERIMIETDCPWCEVRPTHAGFKFVKTTFPAIKKEKWQSGKMIKGRSEPSHIIQIMEVISAVREEDIDMLCNIIYNNTEKVFFPK